MDKVTFITVEDLNGIVEHAIITHADGSFTSMTKTHYEAMQAEQSTPMVSSDK
jgi:hypothetical protein